MANEVYLVKIMTNGVIPGIGITGPVKEHLRKEKIDLILSHDIPIKFLADKETEEGGYTVTKKDIVGTTFADVLRKSNVGVKPDGLIFKVKPQTPPQNPNQQNNQNNKNLQQNNQQQKPAVVQTVVQVTQPTTPAVEEPKKEVTQP